MSIPVLHTLLRSTALQEYIFNTSVLPREHEQLKAIRDATFDKYGQRALINVAPDEGQLMSMLLKIMNAKRTLEIGVFTGYSLLTTALALPDHGQITAIDTDKDAYEVGLPFIRKAGVEHKINFVHSVASPVLDELLRKVKAGQLEPFDFVFVDADKTSYRIYHDKAIELVKIGGIIGYDNTLWFGSVAEEENEVREFCRPGRKAIREFNDYLVSNPRIDICHISIGDGLTLCRRLS
uniref:Caffeoyl-CoA O-methyltransferase n=1 Tax=Kalanchoe fedtschenkoi TaxID=63787 RepID=A0A7N0SZR5_KALFE